MNIIAATKLTARQLDMNKAKQLRVGVSEALRRARPPPRVTWTKGMQRAIRNLQNDANTVILPADKGNAKMVMDRTEYVSKMNKLLEEATYMKLYKHPKLRPRSAEH